MMRWDILNHLIQKNNYKTYLEIGYYKGWSFDRVNCKNKTAVDPFPCKTPEQEQTPLGAVIIDGGHIHKLSSDQYFEKFHSTYDLIFIDGLHEANQVYRDIQNALKHLNPGGMIVLHDCNPPLYEHTTTGINGCWTGDTYRAVLKFRARHPFEFVTIDTDWGVGIIVKSIKEGLYNSPCTGAESWLTFDENRKELLNLISPEEFLEKF